MRIATLLHVVSQADQLRNPDATILVEASAGPLLSEYASSTQGLKTGDDDRWRRFFWEVRKDNKRWRGLQSTVEVTTAYGGRESVIDWSSEGAEMARLQGMAAWKRSGVAIKLMRVMPATLYTGEIFDSNISPIVPRDPRALPAIWCFCESGEFERVVRKVNQKLNVAEGMLVKVPFDLTYWQKVAAERYPNGLPEPHSDDPTQWLFKGGVTSAIDPLQVAVARLLGYRWPEQPKEADAIDKLADKDGIVCIPAVRSKAPASERLLEVLRTAYGSSWTAALLDKLLTDSGCKAGTTLDDWLRNQFFEQHCKRFHQRPFIWHIWDGRKDGFSCLVNYHRLNYKALENLTYAYLQDWITAQVNDAREDKVGADLRLKAAQDLQEKLKAILAGEKPYDIFVRWKPLEEQSIGWNPDLNDGVRMNIRPFVTAQVLRKNPNIKWTKDRGKDPESAPWYEVFGGDRINDHHLTIAEKKAARKKAGK